jgi:hypothetical protein
VTALESALEFIQNLQSGDLKLSESEVDKFEKIKEGKLE